MSTLNLLAEAARMVEFEDDVLNAFGKPVDQYGKFACQSYGSAKPIDARHPIRRRHIVPILDLKSIQVKPDPSNSALQGDWQFQTKTRSFVSGTRKTHNLLEKERRANMKLCFERLKQHVPSICDRAKASNVCILTEAVKYLEELTLLDQEYKTERLKLRRCRRCLEARVKSLQQDVVVRNMQNGVFAQVAMETSCSPTPSTGRAPDDAATMAEGGVVDQSLGNVPNTTVCSSRYIGNAPPHNLHVHSIRLTASVASDGGFVGAKDSDPLRVLFADSLSTEGATRLTSLPVTSRAEVARNSLEGPGVSDDEDRAMRIVGDDEDLSVDVVT